MEEQLEEKDWNTRRDGGEANERESEEEKEDDG